MKGIDHWKPIPLMENVVDGCKVTLVFDNESGKPDAKESIEKILNSLRNGKFAAA